MNTLLKLLNVCSQVNRILIKCCAVFATLLLIILSCVVFAAVVFRMIVNSPFSWSDEFAKYCMVWLTFIGAPVVAARASHVTVDMLLQWFSQTTLHIVRFLIAVFCMLILALFVKYGWGAALSAKSQVIVVLNNTSMFWVYLSIPLGSAIFFFNEFVTAMNELVAIFEKKPEESQASEVN